MIRGLREGSVILMSVVALMLFVALASYQPDDPGFSFTGDSVEVGNLIGRSGAWFADVLYFLFGWPAFLLPVMLLAAGWRLARKRDDQAVRSRANTLVRLGGFAMLLAASCAIESSAGRLT